MTTIVKDLAVDTQLTRKNDGYTAERVYLVDSVGGTAEQKLYNAITAPGIPQYEDPHPILPDVKVTSVTARLYDGKNPGIYKVTVSYSVPTADDIKSSETSEAASNTINLKTSLTTSNTFVDINGDFMVVKYAGGLGISTKYAQAERQQPQMQVSFDRKESTIPKAAIKNYLGKINSVAWSGFPAKTWLCSNIDVREEKEGNFDVTYTFSYNPDTWRFEATIALTQAQIDDQEPDIESGNGYGIFDVYKSIDFSGLGLSF